MNSKDKPKISFFNSVRERFNNALGGFRGANVKPRFDGSDFLRYGTKSQPIYSSWAPLEMKDEDMYKGYSYAAIQRRANGVATVARQFIVTDANQEALDIYQKHGVDPIHPYLKLIRNSAEFSEREFWKAISIYLDLIGVYYLGCVRKHGQVGNDVRMPVLTSDIKKFVLLNPYEIRRVVDANTGEVKAYVERKRDGRQRTWMPYQIIEFKELNPFDNEKAWAITDAAKQNIFTLRQQGDYTAKSLEGNQNTPGIISTDIALSPEDFADFRSRIRNSHEGEPLYANGGGGITWTPMTVDLDKAALSSVNELNRSELMSITGTSKTTLGIEESGTTRETARVQDENFDSKTVQPRVEDIVDALNLDYKKYYKREFDQVSYMMRVKDTVASDYDTELKAVQLRSSQFQLVDQLVQQGYARESASQFAEGKIGVADLQKMEKSDVKEERARQDMAEQLNPQQDEQDKQPEEAVQKPSDEQNPPKGNVTQDQQESGSETAQEGSSDKSNNSIEQVNNDVESLDDKNYRGNGASDEDIKILNKAYKEFLKNIRSVQREIIEEAASTVNQNSFTEKDIMGDDKKESFVDKLVNFYKSYWWVLFPMFANILTNRRNNQFGQSYEFKVTNDIEDKQDKTAHEVAEGHIDTILKDVLKATNRTYDNMVENEAVNLISKDYDKDSGKYVDYFVAKPNAREIVDAIRNTDILDKHKAIYRKAQELALQGNSRRQIIKTIRSEFNNISKIRATTIARNETSRIFNQSQYDADIQFLKSINKLSVAKKRLVSRTGNPCDICKSIIDKGPIPFTDNFVNKGDTIEANGKTFVANYEAIGSGTVHVNCNCRYELVLDNAKTENSLSENILDWLSTHSIEEVHNYIRKSGDQFCVFSENGKKMGCYPSRDEANKRLRQIEYFKRNKAVEQDEALLSEDK